MIHAIIEWPIGSRIPHLACNASRSSLLIDVTDHIALYTTSFDALAPTRLFSTTYLPPPLKALILPTSSKMLRIAGSWSDFTIRSPCSQPISLRNARHLFATNYPVLLLGIMALIAIWVCLCLNTITGFVFCGSPSSPINEKSK